MRRSESLQRTQVESMHGSDKWLQKRAQRLATWLGAETRVPNLVTQITEVDEAQVRAELSWQHHDWCIHKVASADEDFMSQYFARPSEITPAIRKACVLGLLRSGATLAEAWVQERSHGLMGSSRPQEEEAASAPA